MKAEELIRALGDVDDKYIKEAVEYRRKGGGSIKLWRAIAIAACACLAVSALLTMTAINQSNAPLRRDAASPEPVYDDYYAEEASQFALPAGNAAAITYDMAEEAVYEEADGVYEAEPSFERKTAAGAGTDSGEAVRPGSEALIIYSVYMEMQTNEYDNALSEIEQAIAACNGYSESQNQSNNTGAYRSASYTIRIPAENLDAFLEQAEEIGTVTYITKSAEDVSEDYHDTQSRLDTAKAKLTRLQELLLQAEDMADIIEIESAITDTQWEIDSYSGTLKYYDSRLAYSTVSIALQEVYEVITEEAPMTFADKIGQAFSGGARSVADFFRNAVIWLSASWIWLMIVAVAVVAVVLIIRRIRRRKKERD